MGRRQNRARKPAAKRRPGQARPGTPARSTGGAPAAGLTGTYPGDFRGRAAVRYAPAPNGLPEPGEIVWTWVPYEEDYSQGKDRPVLLVGTSGRYLLGLMLTSKDHDGDSRRSDDYVDIGTGPWDRQWRPSEAKLDRVLQINAEGHPARRSDPGRRPLQPHRGRAAAAARLELTRRTPCAAADRHPHSCLHVDLCYYLQLCVRAGRRPQMVGRHRYPHAAQSMANLKAL